MDPRIGQGIDGVSIGHWTDDDGTTGCTAIVLPPDTVASGEVRGGAPATREFALLDPRRMVEHVDAIVLSGGSAFGLATADGVVRWLSQRGRGFQTRVAPVPIVVAMALFDLADGVEPPRADQGHHAADAARPAPWVGGRVGAGAGATLGKWRGPEHARAGGLGIAQVRSGEVTVAAVIAVNARGEIDDGSLVDEITSGGFTPPVSADEALENTTIGAIITNARLDKLGCRGVAEAGHDGLGRALIPVHTAGDGDALVAAATGQLEADVGIVRLLATVAVERAVRSIA